MLNNEVLDFANKIERNTGEFPFMQTNGKYEHSQSDESSAISVPFCPPF